MSKTEAKFTDYRQGLAIPLVLMFCFCILVMAMSLFYFRKESKQQNVTNFQFLQVNFLAQSATQHMLLKLSAFPQDAYDSGVLSLGYCPFRGISFSASASPPLPGNIDTGGLEVFRSDVSIGSLPWLIPDINPADWQYGIASYEIISAYSDPARRQTVLTAQITAIGEGNMTRGNMGTRRERLIKTVQLTGQN